MRAIGSLRRYGDGLLAIGLVVALLLETVAGGAPSPGTWRGLLAFSSELALAASIAWRRRTPLVVLALAVLAASISVPSPLDAPVALILSIVVATFSVGAGTVGRAAVIGAIGVLMLTGIAAIRDIDGDQDPSDLAMPILVVAGPWLAGISIRSRREREVALERASAEEALVAVADERARIARELHDVVAHAIGVIVLQSRGARRMLTSQPEAALEALNDIDGTATQALAEMRRLVGVLRQNEDGVDLAPPSSLRDLDALVERVRAAGLPVTVEVVGTPMPLPPGIDLSAYRIIQEALTNSLTHAGPATAAVRIVYRTDRLDLEIDDTGVGGARGTGAGHGLVGMRERVAIFGGQLQTSDAPGGGFLIKASLPIEGAST